MPKKRKRRTRKRRAKLSLAQSEKAIYIDFEGCRGKSPVLLGMLVAPMAGVPGVAQYVVDPAFETASEATACTAVDLDDLVRSLTDRAEREERRIVTWSEHDLNLVRDYCSADTYRRFAPRYRNARALSEKWREKLYPEVEFHDPTLGNALANYLKMIAYEVPEAFGAGKTGEHLRRLARPLSKGKSWDDLSDDQRGYWRDVLGHNQHDCDGMYRVCQRAASELAGEARERGRSEV